MSNASAVRRFGPSWSISYGCAQGSGKVDKSFQKKMGQLRFIDSGSMNRHFEAQSMQVVKGIGAKHEKALLAAMRRNGVQPKIAGRVTVLELATASPYIVDRVAKTSRAAIAGAQAALDSCMPRFVRAG